MSPIFKDESVSIYLDRAKDLRDARKRLVENVRENPQLVISYYNYEFKDESENFDDDTKSFVEELYQMALREKAKKM